MLNVKRKLVDVDKLVVLGAHAISIRKHKRSREQCCPLCAYRMLPYALQLDLLILVVARGISIQFFAFDSDAIIRS